MLLLVIMIDLGKSSFNGSESDQVISVQIMMLGGIVSSKNIDVNVTFIPVIADG